MTREPSRPRFAPLPKRMDRRTDALPEREASWDANGSPVEGERDSNPIPLPKSREPAPPWVDQTPTHLGFVEAEARRRARRLGIGTAMLIIGGGMVVAAMLGWL